jgi:CBS domain containing-hemolysin-like protein
MESLRLRSHETPALELFKDAIDDRIGLKPDQGSLAFSLIKHTVIIALALIFFCLHADDPLWLAVLKAGVSTWLVVLVFSYILPQWLYRSAHARWLLPLAPLLRTLALPMRPLIALFQFLHALADLGDSSEIEHGHENTAEDNIDALITAGAEEGIIEEEDRKLIQSVVAFGDKRVREVMTPRPNIVAIAKDASLEELRALVLREHYSRIPVYDKTIDQIAGFVHSRDMFELDEKERTEKPVSDLIRPIRFVPETKPVDDLLREMQEGGEQMSIVVDEYGNTAGLVTMEDLVEQIVGEIRDEHEPDADVVEDPQGRFVVSGNFDLDRVYELVGFRPQEKSESTTIGGLVTEWLGRVPRAGEVVEREGIRLEVLAGSELRVEQVRISKLESVKS